MNQGNATMKFAPQAVIDQLQMAATDAGRDMFEAYVRGDGPELTNQIANQHRPVFDALRAARGTALRPDIADLVLPIRRD